jgi:hypothetical protein
MSRGELHEHIDALPEIIEIMSAGAVKLAAVEDDDDDDL